VYHHVTPKGKPHFRYVGRYEGEVELMFLQKGFNVKFRNRFGDNKPDPEGTQVLFEDFDRLREESKQINPDYETSTDDKLTILQSAVLERLASPVTKGMRIAYWDVISLIEEVR
jgi:hypothetical protein